MGTGTYEEGRGQTRRKGRVRSKSEVEKKAGVEKKAYRVIIEKVAEIQTPGRQQELPPPRVMFQEGSNVIDHACVMRQEEGEEGT